MRLKQLHKTTACLIIAFAVVSSLGLGHALGSPSLKPLDAAELSSGDLRLVLASRNGLRRTQQGYRCVGCSHDENVIEKWSLKYFPASYAGMYFKANATRLVVGFTESQAARVRAVKRLPGLIAPKRVSAFLYVPEHSLSELEDLLERILNEVMKDDAHYRLIVSVGVDVEANRVDVGTKRVKKTKEILGELYGIEAPIHVHYEAPLVPVKSK